LSAAVLAAAAAAIAAAAWNRCAAVRPNHGAASPEEEAMDCKCSAADWPPEVELSEMVEGLRRPGRHMEELIAASADTATDKIMNEATEQDNLKESPKKQSKAKPAQR
jgi:hypothetical protein